MNEKVGFDVVKRGEVLMNSSKGMYVLFFVLSSLLLIVLWWLIDGGVVQASILGYINDAELFDEPKFFCQEGEICRTFGYLMVQYVFSFFLNDKFYFILFQILLLTSSVLFLMVSLHDAILSRWIPIFVGCLIMFNPKMLRYSFSFDEEGVFIPIIILISSLFIVLSKRFTVNGLLMISIASGLAIIVRPSGYPLVVAILIGIMLLLKNVKINKILILIVAFFPALFVIASEKAVFNAYNDFERESTLGINVIAKAPMIVESRIEGEYPNVSKIIYERGKRLQGYLDEFEGKFSIQQYLEGTIFPSMYFVIGNYQPLQEAMNIDGYTRDDIGITVFREHFYQNPIGYIMHVARSFIGVWHLSELLLPEDLYVFKKWLDESSMDDYERSWVGGHYRYTVKYAPYAFAAKSIMIILSIIVVLSLLASLYQWIYLKRMDSIIFIGIFFPILLYGFMLLHVAVTDVQLRWVHTYWPLVIVSCVPVICAVNRAVIVFRNKYVGKM